MPVHVPEHIGNVSPDYYPGKRIVKPAGLVDNPSLILKFYQMYKDKPFSQTLLSKSRNFLDVEISEGEISPEIGLGFAILCEDMLNVARWGKDTPYVLINQIYRYRTNENGDFFPSGLVDLQKEGAFCMYELGIVNHEKYLWGQFLNSNKTNRDKKNYRESSFEGTLSI